MSTIPVGTTPVPGRWKPSGLQARLLMTGLILLACHWPVDARAQQTTPVAAPADTVTAPVLRPRFSPTLAVAMTPVMPGWGQLAAGGGWRAVLAFGAEGFYWGHLLMNDRKAARLDRYADVVENDVVRKLYRAQVTEYRERVRDFAWWSAGALLIIALDAYVGAHLQQFDRDPVPVPEHWPSGDRSPFADAAVAPLSGTVLWCWRTSF